MINKILFVCTGNTCRSPMAEALMKDMIARDSKLRARGIEVDSAGFYPAGLPATREAIDLMKEYGLNLKDHRPQLLDQGLLDRADLVLVMTQEHKEDIHGEYKVTDGKISLLSEYVGDRGDVPDPWQRGPEAYRECAASIKSMIVKLLKKL
jgi:protein-tyrosine-phosphatase